MSKSSLMGFGVLCVCLRMFEQDCVFPLLVRWVLPTETRTASHRVNRRKLLGMLPVCFDSSKKCLLSSNLQSRTQAAASLQPGPSSHFLRPPSRLSISRKKYELASAVGTQTKNGGPKFPRHQYFCLVHPLGVRGSCNRMRLHRSPHRVRHTPRPCF